jgi:hypothetical protein
MVEEAKVKWGPYEYDPKKWGTMTECAKELSVTRQRVHQLLVSGKLGDCRKVVMPGSPHGGGVWLIPKPYSRI